MRKFIKLSILIASSLIIVSCTSSGNDGLKPKTTEPNTSKEIKNLFLPIGGFTSGFIYCGFDGEKSVLDEMMIEGWEIKSITPQNFQTSKRNGDIVLCNGSSYILER